MIMFNCYLGLVETEVVDHPVLQVAGPALARVVAQVVAACVDLLVGPAKAKRTCQESLCGFAPL